MPFDPSRFDCWTKLGDRTMYQTNNDAKNEIDVLKRISSLPCSSGKSISFVHYPSPTYMIDGCIIYADGEILRWIEVKARSGFDLKFFARNPAIIDVTKYINMRNLSSMTGIPSYIVFKTKCDCLMIHEVHQESPVPLVIKSNFERRGRGDVNDIDPVFMIPLDDMDFIIHPYKKSYSISNCYGAKNIVENC